MKRYIAGFVLSLSVALIPLWLQAQSVTDTLNASLGTVPQNIGVPPATDLRVGLLNILAYILSFGGIVLVGLIIYAGIRIMLARGNTEEVQAAKDIIFKGVIGFSVVFFSYALVQIITQSIVGTDPSRLEANLGLPVDLRATILNIVKYFLSFGGLAFLIMVLYSGSRILFSQGNPDDIKEAKETLVRAVVGFTIIFFSYTLVQFALNALNT